MARASCSVSCSASGSWKTPISVALAGWSFRRGWPFQRGGSRMRLRSGWPSKAMPNMSHTSRSYQLAEGHRPTMLGRERRSSAKGHLHPDVRVAPEGEEMVDHREMRSPADPAGGRGPARRWRSGRRACEKARLRRSSGRRARPAAASRDTQTVGIPSRVACSSIDSLPKRSCNSAITGAARFHASPSRPDCHLHPSMTSVRSSPYHGGSSSVVLPARRALYLPHGRHLRRRRPLADPPPNSGAAFPPPPPSGAS